MELVGVNRYTLFRRYRNYTLATAALGASGWIPLKNQAPTGSR
jgi:hypothetical protein